MRFIGTRNECGPHVNGECEIRTLLQVHKVRLGSKLTELFTRTEREEREREGGNCTAITGLDNRQNQSRKGKTLKSANEPINRVGPTLPKDTFVFNLWPMLTRSFDFDLLLLSFSFLF